MMLRLIGKEAEALAETDECPFEDGGWAAPQLTYAWKNGLVTGRSETCFAGAEPVSSRHRRAEHLPVWICRYSIAQRAGICKCFFAYFWRAENV